MSRMPCQCANAHVIGAFNGNGWAGYAVRQRGGSEGRSAVTVTSAWRLSRQRTGVRRSAIGLEARCPLPKIECQSLHCTGWRWRFDGDCFPWRCYISPALALPTRAIASWLMASLAIGSCDGEQQPAGGLWGALLVLFRHQLCGYKRRFPVPIIVGGPRRF